MFLSCQLSPTGVGDDAKCAPRRGTPGYSRRVDPSRRAWLSGGVRVSMECPVSPVAAHSAPEQVRPQRKLRVTVRRPRSLCRLGLLPSASASGGRRAVRVQLPGGDVMGCELRARQTYPPPPQVPALPAAPRSGRSGRLRGEPASGAAMADALPGPARVLSVCLSTVRSAVLSRSAPGHPSCAAAVSYGPNGLGGLAAKSCPGSARLCPAGGRPGGRGAWI